MIQETYRLGPDAIGTVYLVQDGLLTREDSGKAFTGPWLRCPDSDFQPGRINAHTHLYSGLVPLGMPPPAEKPQNFLQILERIWWRLDRALDADILRASARLYVAEALLAGTTTLIDHHESPRMIEGSLDILADACQELGIRALLCYGATERNGGEDEARRGLAECRRFIQSNRRDLVRGLVGLHASFTVSDQTLRAAAALCHELDTVLHVHVAEDAADVRDARRRGYDGPLERMIELDALPSGSILAHGVFLTREQVEQADERGVWFVQNPRSNRGNEVGYPRTLSATKRVALGTDGYPAQMFEESLALIEEATAYGDDVESVRLRVEAGWDLNAERFGRVFAPLGPGAAADVAVFAADGLRHLIVGGRQVVGDGKLLTASLAEIRSEARLQAGRLWERMGAL